MLRFTRPPAQQSDKVKIGQIMRTAGGGGCLPLENGSRGSRGEAHPHERGGKISKPPQRLTESPSILSGVIEKKKAEGNFASAPDAVVPLSLPLPMLPLSDIVWSYFGLCYKGIAPM